MATTTTTTNKPLNPRAQDLSPKGYNRANIFSGKALDFDGVNDLVTITSGLDAVAGSRMTIAAWIRLDGISGYPSIISNKVNDGDGFAFLVNPNNNQLFFQYDGTGNQIEAGGKIELNQIYFVTAVYDGTNLKTYINGRNTATSGTATGKVLASTGDKDLFIGRQNTAIGFWNGLIAGLRVFNVGLTAAQVSDLYLNPEKIVPDGVASSALKLWLPMMEGAGASAYDGSGNGNDGTINGATWTAGIGAPVAQTALVSWNKGTNLFRYSEQFNQGSAWALQGGATISANATTAPNGTTTADLLYPSINGSIVAAIQSITTTNGAAYAQSVYVKAAGKNFAALYTLNGSSGTTMWVNLTTGAITNGIGANVSGRFATDEGNGWWRIGMTDLGNGSIGYMHIYPTDAASVNSVTANGTDGIYVWGGAMVQSTTAGPYIKTNATAQTSAVLVPEGLTAGASIFGTDIITPRNAFALNLDGASYAGVHDNASTDLTSAVTLEFWVKVPAVQSGVYGQMIGKRDAADSNWLRFYKTDGGLMVFEGNGGNSLTTATPSDTWTHFVGTINGTSAVLYKNGVSVNSGTLAFNLSEPVPVGLGAWLSSLTQVTSTDSYVENGQLANPRIYNRALTAAEVLRNYNADKAKFGL